ncbi:MAG: glycosyltransferase family 9 protein [Chthoniobacteraceae bacterium]
MAPESILVIKPSSLGDVVHTLPAVSLVRRAWPKARLAWVVNPEWSPLLEGNPDVDEVVIFPRRELGGSPLKTLRWLRELRAGHRSDLVLDFQGLLRSAVMGRFARGGRLAGLSDAREGARYFYDDVAQVGREHAVERYLKLAAKVSAGHTEPLVWNLPPGKRPSGFELAEGSYVLLHPFSRGKGKSLTAEQAGDFAEALACPVVLAGRADATLPDPMPENLVNLLNHTSIAEMIWLIRHARFVVSVDSGPMHIAAALTPNLLSIHTWSDPRLVGPYRPEAWILKDRTLFQARELREGPATGKPLAAPDIKAVAAHVATLIGG